MFNKDDQLLKLDFKALNIRDNLNIRILQTARIWQQQTNILWNSLNEYSPLE